MTTIADLMTPDPVTITEEGSVAAVVDLFEQRRFRHVPVVDADGAVVGVLSQRDILRATCGGRAAEELTVGELMSRTLTTANPEAAGAGVARHMLAEKQGCVPVVDGEGRVVGIVTEADFVRAWLRGEPR